MLILIHGCMILLFLFLGIILSQGKGAFLIAGYNTSTKKEKSKYDEKALCKTVGKMMFSMAGCWCVVAIGSVLETLLLFWLGLGLFLAVTIGGVIYLNTGNRCKK